MCRKRCVYSLHGHIIWENISFNRHVWIEYMERTTQCFGMLPEAQQFLIGSCQSKSLSTLKRLCLRMATRSKQTRRKPRTRHPSLQKNGCNVLNSETGLFLWRTATRKNIIHRANRFSTRNSPNGLWGMAHCCWIAWSVASHLEMIEQKLRGSKLLISNMYHEDVLSDVLAQRFTYEIALDSFLYLGVAMSHLTGGWLAKF